MAVKTELDVEMEDGSLGRLSYYPELKLVMLHTTQVSAQWGDRDFVPTVEVQTEKHFKLGLQTHLSNRFPNVYTDNYQSFFISMKSYDRVVKFFGDMGFPMERCVTLGREQYAQMTNNTKH